MKYAPTVTPSKTHKPFQSCGRIDEGNEILPIFSVMFHIYEGVWLLDTASPVPRLHPQLVLYSVKTFHTASDRSWGGGLGMRLSWGGGLGMRLSWGGGLGMRLSWGGGLGMRLSWGGGLGMRLSWGGGLGMRLAGEEAWE